MELQSDKLVLIQALLQVKDEKVLNEIKQLLASYFSENKEIDIWDELTKKDQAFVKQARKDIKDGKGIPHEEAMKSFREQLGQ